LSSTYILPYYFSSLVLVCSCFSVIFILIFVIVFLFHFRCSCLVHAIVCPYSSFRPYFHYLFSGCHFVSLLHATILIARRYFSVPAAAAHTCRPRHWAPFINYWFSIATPAYRYFLPHHESLTRYSFFSFRLHYRLLLCPYYYYLRPPSFRHDAFAHILFVFHVAADALSFARHARRYCLSEYPLSASIRHESFITSLLPPLLLFSRFLSFSCIMMVFVSLRHIYALCLTPRLLCCPIKSSIFHINYIQAWEPVS